MNASGYIFTKQTHWALNRGIPLIGSKGGRGQPAAEVERFTALERADEVRFHALTYQGLIVRLAQSCREGHEGYVRYLTEKYL